MAIEWNRYLARYQQERGGYFFGNGDSCWDGYLVLAEGPPRLARRGDRAATAREMVSRRGKAPPR